MVFVDACDYYAVLEPFFLTEEVVDPWEMCKEGSSDFEDSIIVESKVLLSQFVLAEHLDGEVEGGIVKEEQGGLSFVAAGRFAELVAYPTHVCVDQSL